MSSVGYKLCLYLSKVIWASYQLSFCLLWLIELLVVFVFGVDWLSGVFVFGVFG